MKVLRCLVAVIIFAISGNIMAQSQLELSQLMRNRGEYYFTLSIDDFSKNQELGDLCSVDATNGQTVVCYANQQEYDKLLELGLQPNLETPPSLRANVTMWDGLGTYNWDSYLTYPQYVSMMENFPSKALSDRNCSLINLGTLSNDNQRQLLGIRIYKDEPYGKPKFLYSSTMHGDEVTGMILMLRLIDELCTSTDSRIDDLLSDVDIYIFPCTNPDGTYANGNNTVNGATRYNGNSKDLNRNYRDFFNGDHPDNNNYQEETQWNMAFADENLFTMAANYHGGSEVMNYCWDWVFQDHADMDWWEYVCAEYVTLARQNNASYMGGYYQNSSNYDYDGVTNGATWYSITGSRQDYMNGYAQCREVTVECSETKLPSASELPNFWNYSHNSMLTLMEQARNGVHGVVHDASTGQTIQGVTVSVLNHDINNSWVTTHEAGDFHRPIKGGSYTFVFDKEGYARKFVEVTVADEQRVDLNVNLTPSSAAQTDCYQQVNVADIVAGPYLMGYQNGSTLIMPSHNNTNISTSVTMSATSLSVTPTDDGFTLPHDIDRLKIALEPSGATGQYHILYKGRMLQRSGSSLVWAKPRNSSGSGVDLSPYRWYINANGVYYQSGSTKYYLYYNGSSFTTNLSQCNITFYKEMNCPPREFTVAVTASPEEGGVIEGADTYLEGETCTLTATAAEDYLFVHWTENGETVSSDAVYSFEVTGNRNLVAHFNAIQTAVLYNGWNWFVPTVEITLADLEEALGENGLIIKTQTETVFYEEGEWAGDNLILIPGHMYKIRLSSDCTINLSGSVVSSNITVTIMYGSNWFGYTGPQKSIETILSDCGFSPVEGDIIKTSSQSTFYEEGEWAGDFTTLNPGQGYVYISKDQSPKQLTF
jgi:hypothetical protein